MNVTRSATLMCCALAAVLLGGFGNRALGQGGGGDAPPILDAKKMRMQPEDAIAPLKIFGDSSKEGFYIYRNRFGPHQTSRPHYHDKDRWGMVIRARGTPAKAMSSSPRRWCRSRQVASCSIRPGSIITMARWTIAK